MTPLQLIKSLGFKEAPRAMQNSRRYTYYVIMKDGKVVAKAGQDVRYYSRNPGKVMVDVGGKQRIIYANDVGGEGYQRFNAAQMAKLESLLKESIATGAPPEKPKKPRPPSPNKGKVMSAAEKLHNRIWRRLGELTCIGFINKDIQERMSYVKSGKYIRLEDWDGILAYANLRDHHLEEIGMTVDDLEKFLMSRGIKRKPQKRMRYTPPLYD